MLGLTFLITDIFPSMVGRSIIRAATRIDDVEVKDLMVGDNASKLRSMLECKNPMEKGLVRSWEHLQHVGTTQLVQRR